VNAHASASSGETSRSPFPAHTPRTGPPALPQGHAMTVTDPLLHFCQKSPNDNAETMLTEIMLGVRKEDASSVFDAETSDLWDRLSAECAEINARGHAVVYDNGA
jgi:hypothetical protein